jgi:hypothetical protein
MHSLQFVRENIEVDRLRNHVGGRTTGSETLGGDATFRSSESTGAREAVGPGKDRRRGKTTRTGITQRPAETP